MISVEKLIKIQLKDLLVYGEALSYICNRYEANIAPLYNPLQGMSTLTPEQQRLNNILNKYKGIQSMVMQAIEIKTEQELIELCTDQKKELSTETTQEPKKTKIRKNAKTTKKIKG